MISFCIVLSVIAPFLVHHTSSFGVVRQRAPASVTSRSTKPNVVQNGTDVVSLPFAAPVAAESKIGFTPDGSGYFIDAGKGDALFRISPTGTLTTFPDLHADSYFVLYAQGNLWTRGDSGIVKIKPDGSGHHWYELNLGTSKGYAQGIVAGSDGAVYTVIQYLDHGYTASNYLYRIDARGGITSVKIPINSVLDIVAGANGDFYLAYDDTYGATGKEGVMRFRFDGTAKLFPVYAENGVTSLAFTKGNLYFVSNLRNGISYLGRIAPGDILTQNSFPTQYWFPGNLAVDFGGNIWITNDDATNQYTGYALYQYDTYTGRFSGPYEPAAIDNTLNGFVNVGPDDNIWYLQNQSSYTGAYGNVVGVGIFVRKVQTLEPSITNTSVGEEASFSILETHYDGPWTANSLSPSVAVVASTLSTTGTFDVSAISHGSAQIQVKDRLGNVSYETVNVK